MDLQSPVHIKHNYSWDKCFVVDRLGLCQLGCDLIVSDLVIIVKEEDRKISKLTFSS